MGDRDKWLTALAEFGRGPDIGEEYAKHCERKGLLMEIEMRDGRRRQTLFLSNDNDRNYSAQMLVFPTGAQIDGAQT